MKHLRMIGLLLVAAVLCFGCKMQSDDQNGGSYVLANTGQGSGEEGKSDDDSFECEITWDEVCTGITAVTQYDGVEWKDALSHSYAQTPLSKASAACKQKILKKMKSYYAAVAEEDRVLTNCISGWKKY
ncbi:MAG: hypothetical protein OXC44_05995 [Proteobacteria bacterium]|nr:hypothetical protein [Pseudomonadota bacterium]